MRPVIRASTADDRTAFEALYSAAFPDEDLLPLVGALLSEPALTRSLVATSGGQVVGHVLFTRCGIGEERDVAALLGPVAVSPSEQQKGIGSALIRAGLQALQGEGDGVSVVLVLGDPAYYGRFGFQPESAIEPPYPLPAEWDGAWRSLRLGADAELPSGTLSTPEPWRQPKLWAP